jgi:4-aminobutyrate aminotransferase-like enzyme
LVEPIQGRGGIVVPPDDFLPGLRKFCNRHGLLLICDEIYTGFCRTGRWFACEHWDVQPDLICVGKGMAGGLPLAACIGRAAVMDSWPLGGEAIHTSTFLGHPLGCAAALASIAEMKRLRLADRAAQLGRYVQARLPVRGKGLMLGLRVTGHPVESLLRRGILALQEGDVLGLTPPLTITERELDFAIGILECGGLTPPSKGEA